MKRSVVVAPETLSHDTVQCLEQLLDKARKGEIIGLAFAAMCRRRQYMVDTAGEAHRNLTYARGMVCALNDELGQRIRG
jgi:hypothetical protein